MKVCAVPTIVGPLASAEQGLRINLNGDLLTSAILPALREARFDECTNTVGLLSRYGRGRFISCMKLGPQGSFGDG